MATLLFIYNAESGFANALLDSGRRIFKPQTYPCSLCMLTYGPFGMDKDWRTFTKSLPYDVSFIHKDELPTAIQSQLLDLPCLLLQEDSNSKLLISGKEFRAIKSLDSLKKKVWEVLNLKS